MLLIGSQALKFWGFDRNPRDWDFISNFNVWNSWAKNYKWNSIYPVDEGKKIIGFRSDDQIFEAEIAWENSTGAELIELCQENEALVFSLLLDTKVAIPSLDVLLAIKLSHRYLKDSPHFLKTMRDIWDLRKAGAVVPGWLTDWLKRREQSTYTYKHPNLKQSKEGFFDKNQGITYIWDHDSIHEAVKQQERPAYTYFKDDQAEVFCSRKLFLQQPREIQLNAVLEESYVLALERSQIPFPGKVSPKISFEKALSKICTSITSGWFREFAWENYHSVQKLYRDNYLEKFQQGIETGIVRPFDSNIQNTRLY